MAKTATATTTKSKMPSVRDQIRSYGASGNISKRELLKISEGSKKNPSQVIKQLDAVNSKLSSNKKNVIGLGSAAANAYSKGKLGPVNNPFLGGGKAGTGPIATALGQMMDRTTGSMLGQGQGVRTIPGTGLIPKGQQIFGSYNGAPQIRTKPALAGYSAPTKPNTTTTPTDTVNTGGDTGSDTGVNTEDMLPLGPVAPELKDTPVANPSDPFSTSGAFSWRTQRGKKKGSKSTSAASRAKRQAPYWQTLGM